MIKIYSIQVLKLEDLQNFLDFDFYSFLDSTTSANRH